MPRAFWWLFGVFLITRVFFAVWLPLGWDEAYQFAVAKSLSWSFFDHPPLSFWAAELSYRLIGTDFALRLPGIIFGSFSLYFLWRLSEEIADQRAAVWACVLFMLSPFFHFSGAMFLMPDPPLNMGLLLAGLALVKLLKTPDTKWFLWAGLGLAIAFLSKYQAALFAIAVLGFLVARADGRRLFSYPAFWAGLAIALLGALPVLIWNIQNDWASLSFHTGRAGQSGLNMSNAGQMLFGQIAYLLPVTLILSVICLIRFGRSQTLLVVAALATLVPFFVIYLISSGSLPHWTMPGWLFALPLAGMWLAAREQKIWGAIIGITAIPFWGLVLAISVHLSSGIFTGKDSFMDWDQTVTQFVWPGLEEAIEERDMDFDLLATRSWHEGGIFSKALDRSKPVKVLFGREGHFAFMDGEKNGPAVFMAGTRFDELQSFTDRQIRDLRGIDPDAVAEAPIVLTRNGVPYIGIFVARITVP